MDRPQRVVRQSQARFWRLGCRALQFEDTQAAPQRGNDISRMRRVKKMNAAHDKLDGHAGQMVFPPAYGIADVVTNQPAAKDDCTFTCVLRALWTRFVAQFERLAHEADDARRLI